MAKDSFDFTGALTETSGATGGAGTGKKDSFDFTGALATPPPAPKQPASWTPVTSWKPEPTPEKKPGLIERVTSAVSRAVKPVVKFMVDPGKNVLGPKQGGQGVDQIAQPLVDKTLNTETGRKVARFVSEKTTDLPLKFMAFVEATGGEITFRDAYKSLQNTAKGGDIKQKMANALLSTAPQSAIGVALAFVPYAGKPLASTYWSLISADEQIREKGRVDSITNIGIDVIGDSLLGASIEKMLGTSASVLVKSLKNAGVEGATEVAQAFLKYGNDLKNAKTPQEREVIIAQVKEYIRSGAIAIEFVAGAGAGAAITGAATAVGGARPQVQVAPTVQEPPKEEDFTGTLTEPEAQVEAPAPDTTDFTGTLAPEKAEKPIKITKSGARRFESASAIIKKDMDEDRSFAASLYGQGLTFEDDIAAFEQYVRQQGDPQLVAAMDEYRASRGETSEKKAEEPMFPAIKKGDSSTFVDLAQAKIRVTELKEQGITAHVETTTNPDGSKLHRLIVDGIPETGRDVFEELFDTTEKLHSFPVGPEISPEEKMVAKRVEVLEKRAKELLDETTVSTMAELGTKYQEYMTKRGPAFGTEKPVMEGQYGGKNQDTYYVATAIGGMSSKDLVAEFKSSFLANQFADEHNALNEKAAPAKAPKADLSVPLSPEVSDTDVTKFNDEMDEAGTSVPTILAGTGMNFAHAMEGYFEIAEKAVEPLKKRLADLENGVKGLRGDARKKLNARIADLQGTINSMEGAVEDRQLNLLNEFAEYAAKRAKEKGVTIEDVEEFTGPLSDFFLEGAGRESNWNRNVGEALDDFIAEFAEESGQTEPKYRTTPAGQPKVPDLVKPGDIVTTTYNVFQGKPIEQRVVGVTGPHTSHYDGSQGHSVEAPESYSITIVGMDDKPNKSGKYRDSDYGNINEVVAVDGRLLFLSGANEDEVFVKGESGQLPEKGGTMGANGGTSNVQGRERGVSGGGLPETASVAPEQPGDAGGVPNEPGKQAVRREPGKRGSGVGERPGKPDLGGLAQFNNLTQEQVATAVGNLTVVNEGHDGVLNVFAKSREAAEKQHGVLPTYEQLRSQFLPAGGNTKKGASGRGLLDEYFTPRPVVELAWKLAQQYVSESQLGLILEPSVGTGNFVTWAPEEYREAMQGMEINETAARIAALAFEDTALHIQVRPMESLFRGKRGEEKKPAFSEYALVIGNPPYGEHRGEYLGLGEEPNIVKYETYFIKRSLDLTAQGGYVVMVVPSAILTNDTGYSGKEEIATLGMLVEARRLPAGVFGTTGIGTDILVFKRTPTLSLKDGSNDRLKIRKRMQAMSNDAYFATEPDHVVGETSTRKGRFGEEEFVKGDISNVEAAVRELSDEPPALDTRSLDGKDVPINEGEEAAAPEVQQMADVIRADPELLALAIQSEAMAKAGTYSEFEKTQPYRDIYSKVKGPHKDLLKRVAEDDTLGQAIKVVGALGEKKTGLPPALAKTVKPTKPGAYVHKSTKKAKVLSMSTGEMESFWKFIEPTGEVSPSYAAGQGLSITNPKTFNVDTNPDGTVVFVPSFNYLQGNIYAKLERLEALKEKLPGATYEKQKGALQAVLPTPRVAADIAISPNSEFVAGLKLGETTLRDRFSEWLQDMPYKVFESVSRYDIMHYIQGRPVSSGDKELNRKTRRERRRIGDKLFRTFLREGITDSEKDDVASAFNRKFNGYVRPDYTQVPLTLNLHSTFKGKPLTVRPHQRQGVGFIVNKGLGLLAHDVGLGKTMEGIIAMGEIMHRGWAKRPLVVVPNAVYEKWSRPTPNKAGHFGEIQELLPDVTVNRLGNLGGKFNGDLATLDVADGSVSVISYEALAKLGFSDETYDQLTMGLRDAMIQMGGTERDIEKQGAKVSEVIGKAKKGTSVERFFDELGFDFVMMDEVHNFKNIFAGAKGKKGERGANEFRNVRGSSSQRGVRSYLMAQYILGRNKGRNVVGLSATPFSNSPMEIYSILSLFAKKRMEEMGVTNVNEFMSLFMDMTPKFVVKADRSVVEEDVVERYKNLGQLQALVTEYIDFRTGEEVGIPRPAKDKRTVVLHPTALQQEYLDAAQDLFMDKENGGAIVAITEQQSITLSPFLSRYYNGAAPTPDSLADNSPKIKQAVAAMKQNLKDQPKAGQVFYMPRGTELYPILKQYIVEQIGLKSAQVAIIEGGMTPEKKQGIQDDFNAGKVKVLIGSEAIKEGVDLQETSTDVHHLHLPWNPTDMIQVEGRVWRQGNQWKNVRIHYYLIENSVDQFIFQKLETKEKRIKSVWSYKGDNIEVGDLDFENMKLDLITDPVVRVQAEAQFESSALKAQTSEKEAELAYIGRRIERRTEIEENLTATRERLATATTDYNKGYYQERLTDLQAELDVLNGERSVGTDEEIKARMDSLTTSLASLAQQKEDMAKAYEVKLANAKTESKETVLVPNDYATYQGQLADENKAFFVKASEQSTPTGNANTRSIGVRPEINTDAVGLVDKVRPMELPEIVHLAKELMGNYPTVVKNIKNSAAVGMFRGIEGVGPRDIRLVAGLFDSKNVADASIVLAHEVGHLTDFLPENTMKRGNIRDRLMLVKSMMKETFGEQIKVKEIKQELVELTRWWNPYDPDTVPKAYKTYRESSRELYAEAISVLLNAPADLAVRAPTFYKAFFATLDEKPDVYEAYFAIQELLTDPEKVQETRHERLVEGFKRGNEAQLEATAKRKGRAYSLWLRLRMLFDDKYAPATVKVRKAEQAGAIVPPDENPKFLLDELPFTDNENFVLLETIQEQVREPVEAAGFTDVEIGEYLFHSRVLTGRADVANPLGFSPKTSQEQLDRLKVLHGDEAFAVMEEKVKLFHEIVFKSVDEAVRVGYYNRKTYEETILPNRYNYAAFGVVDYLTDRMPAGVKKQIGTLKEVANPFITTILKTIALNRVNAIQRAKTTMRTFLQTNFSGEITEAKAIKGPENITLRHVAAEGMGLLELFEDGKPVAYSVDPYIAESFANDSGYLLNLINNSVGSILSKPNNVFKALFTTYRPGFALAFNPIRDVKRNYKIIPGATIYNLFAVKRNVLLQFLRSLPEAAKFAKGELTPFTEMLVDIKAVHAPFGDQHYDPSEDEFTRLLQKYHIGADMNRLGWGTRARKAILKPLIIVLDAMRFAGNTFETAGKLSGARIRIARGEAGRSLAYNVRNFTGTPNWSKKGLLTTTTNNIWLFSNIMKEGMKSDYITATGPKTAAGYWWKTAKVDFLPKLLMFLAAAGLFGEWLKEFFGKVSEYDKTNYTIIPLGVGENGKAVYLRIPHDEGGRLEAAVFWKLMNVIKDKDPHGLTGIFQFGAGQLPSLSPTISIPRTWKEYFSGHNPVDSFRGRNIIDDVTFTAGGWAPMEKMLQWTGNQVGVFNFATFDPSGRTGIETFVQVAPWFSSLFKISDYGEVESFRGVRQEVKADEAQETLRRRELLDSAINAIREDGPDSVNKHAREAAKELLGHWPRNPDENTKFNVMVKRVKEEYLGRSEGPAMDVLIEASTREQQKTVLKEIRTRMTDEEWSAFRRKAINGRIVQPEVFFGI